MKLPNLENVLIEEAKITAYLLSEENLGGKAAFFTSFGFALDRWEVLREALIYHASIHEVKRSSETIQQPIIQNRLPPASKEQGQVIVPNGVNVAQPCGQRKHQNANQGNRL